MLREKVEYLRTVYASCERSASAEGICEMWAGRFRLLAKFYFATIHGAVLTFMLMPLIVYVTVHTVEPVLPTPIMFVDIETTLGYRVAYVVHSLSLLISAVGMVSADLTIFFLAMHICLLSDVFVIKLSELQAFLHDRKCDYQPRSYGEPTKRHVSELVRMHQELCMYETDIASMFYVMFLIDVVLDCSSMCLCLFAAMQMRWVPLYTEMFGTFMRLAYSCIMGTVVEHYVSGED